MLSQSYTVWEISTPMSMARYNYLSGLRILIDQMTVTSLAKARKYIPTNAFIQYTRIAFKIGQIITGGRENQKQAGANNVRLPELTWAK